MRVLLTGGSGFIAGHCLEQLLASGHSVVTTVRSHEKGKFLQDCHPSKPLSYVIVKDIAEKGAFDDAVKSDPPFEAVIHTASPFHYQVTDNKKDLLDPAILGTTEILKAIKAYAPTVKRVAITSSFASITNPGNHPKVYSEDVWNPMTMEEALETSDPQVAYRGSKKFAEVAAWDFVEKEKPNFQLSTLNPPFVFGPVVQYLTSIDDINTSNKRILNMIQGKKQTGPTGSSLWVDVRDVALAHIRAVEVPEAAGKRFFITAGPSTDAEIGSIIRDTFPDLASNVPAELGNAPSPFEADNSRSIKVLGIQYRSLRECVVDTVKSIQKLMKK